MKNNHGVWQVLGLVAVIALIILLFAMFVDLEAVARELRAADVRPALSLGALAISPPSAPTQPALFHVSTVAPLAAVGFDAEALTAYAVILHILEMVWMIGLALWGMFQIGLSPQVLLKRKHLKPSGLNS